MDWEQKNFVFFQEDPFFPCSVGISSFTKTRHQFFLVNGNSSTNELYADVLTFLKRNGSQQLLEFFPQPNDCVAKNELFIFFGHSSLGIIHT